MRVTNEDETIISSYSYDAAEQRIHKIVDDTDTKYVYDSLNLVASLVNNSLFEYNYLETDGSIILWYAAYTGAVIDEKTGLYYMNARYYDPETGRFISQDSYRGENESFWHLYVYCDADPVNGVDPTGHVALAFAGTAYAIGGQMHGIQ